MKTKRQDVVMCLSGVYIPCQSSPSRTTKTPKPMKARLIADISMKVMRKFGDEGRVMDVEKSRGLTFSYFLEFLIFLHIFVGFHERNVYAHSVVSAALGRRAM